MRKCINFTNFVIPDKDKNKEKEWEPTHNKVNNDGSSSYRQKWNNQPAQERNRGRDKVTFSSSSTEKKSRDDRGGNSRWQSNNQSKMLKIILLW